MFISVDVHVMVLRARANINIDHYTTNLVYKTRFISSFMRLVKVCDIEVVLWWFRARAHHNTNTNREDTHIIGLF